MLDGLLGQDQPASSTRSTPTRSAARLDEVLAGSIEGGAQCAARASGASPRRAARPAASSALGEVCHRPHRARPRAGKIDPVVGRDPEIRQIVDVLMRRRQNNPILTGEAGVGKTAVVEGFALRIAEGDVPPTLQNVSLRMLDVGLMQAGASVKGEFEKRLRSVIEEVQSSETPIILFIDEAHTLIGAGGAAGTGDAANLLKPALARGELRTIAATTWSEYKQHIEKDPALTRRFQVVQGRGAGRGGGGADAARRRGDAREAPRGADPRRGDRGGGRACRTATSRRGSSPTRRSACSTPPAPASPSPSTPPRPRSRTCAARRQMLEVEQGIIDREEAIGIEVAERGRRSSSAGWPRPRRALAAAEARWERGAGARRARSSSSRARLRGEGVPLDAAAEAAAPSRRMAEAAEAATATAAGARAAPDREADLAELRALMAELAAAQGETPLILPSVDRNAVAAVVQDWTGIPTGRMLTSQTEKALNLAAILAERVVGQDHAMEMIARRVQTSRAGLGAPEKPVGVFLLCGPSGVGKTETALALAETLYGGEQNLITINMSEFQEAHTVSLLKGAPPGYVGYGKGGVLTEAVRRKPYSVDPARRGGEGPPRRARDLLPGLRQGDDGRQRGAADRLQELPDPAHLERRLRGHHAG